MKTGSDWQIIRRQVAIGGRVVNENNNPVAGAQITIKSMPDGFKRQLEGAISEAGAGWLDQEERQDRARSRLDGIYFFLDLPKGSYTLGAVDPQTGQQGEKRASVTMDKKKNLKMARTDFKLSV